MKLKKIIVSLVLTVSLLACGTTQNETSESLVEDNQAVEEQTPRVTALKEYLDSSPRIIFIDNVNNIGKDSRPEAMILFEDEKLYIVIPQGACLVSEKDKSALGDEIFRLKEDKSVSTKDGYYLVFDKSYYPTYGEISAMSDEELLSYARKGSDYNSINNKVWIWNQMYGWSLELIEDSFPYALTLTTDQTGNKAESEALYISYFNRTRIWMTNSNYKIKDESPITLQPYTLVHYQEMKMLDPNYDPAKLDIEFLNEHFGGLESEMLSDVVDNQSSLVKNIGTIDFTNSNSAVVYDSKFSGLTNADGRGIFFREKEDIIFELDSSETEGIVLQ